MKPRSNHSAKALLFLACSACGGSDSDSSSETGLNDIDESIIMAASSVTSPASAISVHSDPLYFTPFPFSTVLQHTYTPSNLATTTGFTNRKRFLVRAASGNYLGIGTSGAVTANSTLSTYSHTLSKTFEAIVDASNSSWFRLDSELHALYSLDSDASGNLSFANNWGSASSPTGRGYVVFYFDPATGKIQAKARYSYNLSTYSHASTSDASFPAQGYYLQENAGTFRLVASSGAATVFSIVSNPINVEIPSDFNPDATPYVSNSRVSILGSINNSTSNMEGAPGKVYENLKSAYSSQVSSTGANSSTAAAASSMLNTIESTLISEGSSLRYPKALYLAFRNGLLNQTLSAEGIANGTLGMQGTPYVYFTNEADDSGVHHPFMVIATYSIGDKPNRLVDVCRPPGDGTTAEYTTQSVTRDATLQLYLVKIPMKDYGEVSALTDNTMQKTLNSDAGATQSNTVYNYASTSGVGVASDGVVIYPVLNNTLATAPNNAEVTSTGIHVGQGMGLHYHADGHTAVSNDFALYNIHDYPGQSHPPLIGMAFDGIAIFGIYETAYPSMLGYSTGLDSFGGHSHDALGYHYHTHMSAATSLQGNSYTLHILLRGAWKGRINEIPEFWDSSRGEPAYSLSQRNRYVGKQ